jgi:hypothetical protein
MASESLWESGAFRPHNWLESASEHEFRVLIKHNFLSQKGEVNG